MPKEFPRPTFLRPETSIKPGFTEPEIGEKHYHQGSYSIVGELKRIPQEMRKMVPEGFVLKKYYLDEYSSIWYELFDDEAGQNNKSESWVKFEIEGACNTLGRHPNAEEVFDMISEEDRRRLNIDLKLVAGVLNKYSIESKAQKLKQRHDRIKGYFSEELPDVIVPTQFVIGTEKNKKEPERDGPKYLYEIQPRIQGLNLNAHLVKDYMETGTTRRPGAGNFLYEQVPLDIQIIENAKSWAKQIKTEIPDKAQQIKNELVKFIEIARQLPERTKEIPYDMVHPFNLKVTKNGLRIFDVNQVLTNFEQGDERRKHFHTDNQLARYFKLLEFWQVVADEL